MSSKTLLENPDIDGDLDVGIWNGGVLAEGYVHQNERDIASGNLETSLAATATGNVGTITIPVGFWRAGKTIRIFAAGLFGTAVSAPTFALRLRWGTAAAGTILADSGTITTTGSLSAEWWYLTCDVCCRSTGVSGSFMAQGEFFYKVGENYLTISSSAAVTADTTGATNMTMTQKWGTASSSNSQKVEIMTLEVLN